MRPLIRRYRPSDRDSVLSLISVGTLEHISPCFVRAVSSPLYLCITLTLCVVGLVLSSLLAALLLPAAWLGLVYYCCHQLYSTSVTHTLQTDLQDIPGSYLSRPEDCFWVAEAECDGRAQIVGMVAVVGRQNDHDRYGEMVRMVVSPSCRRMGLGVRLTQTVMDFCKDRGFSSVFLEVGSARASALALYRKLGFSLVNSPYSGPEAPSWVVTLTRASVFTMRKQL